jgi:Zn-dependent peptidase ImmA (M78 family)
MRIRWVLCLCIFLGLNSSAPALVQKTDESDLIKVSDEMIQLTTRLRGLEPKAPILRGVKNRDEIAKYLNEHVQEEYKEGELQNEGKMLKKLGLIPDSMDYKEFIIKLFTEQVGGFYNPENKTFYIASWLPVEDQKPIMVHELTHALQDQYFNIEAILEQARKQRNDDRGMAHQALFEGDALLVMLQSIIEPFKRHFSELPDLSFIMRTQMATMQSQFAVYKSAPMYIQEILLFPYAYGASFVQQVWKHTPSWEAVNKIYSDLPASTEQIMHPEKYLTTRDNPITVDAKAYIARLGKDWKVAYKNVLGEFSLGLLLSLHSTEERARRSTTGWGGDQVLLLENTKGKDAVLVSTVWDTVADAEKFYIAMDQWFVKQFPEKSRTDESPAGFSIIQNEEFNALRREGNAVRFIIGMPEADSKNLVGF